MMILLPHPDFSPFSFSFLSFSIHISQIIAASSSALHFAAAFLDNLDHLCPSSDCGTEAAALRLRLNSLAAASKDHSTSAVINERLLELVIATFQKLQASYLRAASRYLFVPMVLGAALQMAALLGLVLSSSSIASVTNGKHNSSVSTFFCVIVVVIAVASFFLSSPSSLSSLPSSWSRFFWSQMSFLEVFGVVVTLVGYLRIYDLKLPSLTDKLDSRVCNGKTSTTASSNLIASSLSSALASTLSSFVSSSRLDAAFSAVCLLIHAATLGSSSFVEEEHFTWYFLVNTSILFFFLRHFLPTQPSNDQMNTSAGDPVNADASFSPDSSLNSSNYEISYSWEDRDGAAGLKNETNGGLGRQVFRRGTGNIAFLNSSSCEENSRDSSLGSTSLLNGR